MVEKGVMKVSEFKNSVMYRVMCDCIEPNCDMVLDFDFDEELGIIFLNLYKKLHWSSYYFERRWYERLWTRIKKACLVLFKGWIEVDESLVLKDLDHIENFKKAIEEGIVFVKKRQEEFLNEKRQNMGKVE